MHTFYAAILCKTDGLAITVFPPDDIEIFNFASVPIGKSFDGYKDTESPFPDLQIPVGTRWMYSAHPIIETGNPEVPLRAGGIAAGPFLVFEEAKRAADEGEKLGFFTCIYAALVVGDPTRLH